MNIPEHTTCIDVFHFSQSVFFNTTSLHLLHHQFSAAFNNIANSSCDLSVSRRAEAKYPNTPWQEDDQTQDVREITLVGVERSARSQQPLPFRWFSDVTSAQGVRGHMTYYLE